jgi:hypothetical protein
MAGTVLHPYFGDDVPRRRTTDASDRLRRIERLSWILDRAIPFGRFRFGLDPIIGIIPGVGDWLGAILSFYVLYEGARLGVRGGVVLRMTLNILIEATLGAIPVLGDIFDFAWQANTRNIALIHRHYRPGLEPRSLQSVWRSVAIALVIVLCVLALLTFLIVKATLALWEKHPITLGL